jgi:signal transduction histidine kinase
VSIRTRSFLLGAVAAVLGAAGSAAEAPHAADVVASGIAGAGLGVVPFRPRAAWLIAAVVAAVSCSIGPPSLALGLLVSLHAYCAAREEDRWGGIAALVALVGALELGLILDNDSAVPGILLPGAAWAAGRALRERENVAAQLAERVRELEQEREAHAALSVRYERARIAAELHDIVAHAISVMVVQAGAGQRLAHDPDQTAEVFGAIAGAARQAEQDMGRLVALLGDEAAIGPAPDLALVEELVQRAAGSGLAVTLRFEGEREGLPTAHAEIAYRVVQEGLTNALRYAAGASVRVLVRGDRDGLLVEVANAPTSRERALAGAGMGTGLQGLRERVAAHGGTLHAGRMGDGGWRLAARLPKQVPAVAAGANHPRG